MQLLIVPLMLALVGVTFALVQDFNQQINERAINDRQQRAEDQRTQDVALQAYLDQMGRLILDDGLLGCEGSPEACKEPQTDLVGSRTLEAG